MSYVVGVLGMCLIVLGWIISIKTVPPLRLSLLYGIGSILLAAYAYSLSDMLFLSLNSMAATLSFINVIRALKEVRIREK